MVMWRLGGDHGFAAFAPPAAGPTRPVPLHLAATFRDGHVAFLPLTVCDGADAAVRSRMLASVEAALGPVK